MPVSDEADVAVTTLKAILEAFNQHDLDRIMTYFAEDCTLQMPRGHDPWGQRFVGKAHVRDGLMTRFAGMPNVHYSEDQHWVCGNRGVSEWLLTGTTTTGQEVHLRGCDLWEFCDGRVSRKDSYWKAVEP